MAYLSTMAEPKKVKKTSLIPIFRRIHPDLFAQELPYIRQGNMDCMKKLTELIGVLDSYQEALVFKPAGGSTECSVTSALQPVYDIKCYAYKSVAPVASESTSTGGKETSNDENRATDDEDRVIYQVGMKITVPSFLTTKQSIARKDLKSSVHMLRKKINQFCEQLEVELPWPAQKSQTTAEKTAEAQATTDEDLEDVLFESKTGGVFISEEQHEMNVFEHIMKTQNSLASWTFFGNSKEANRNRELIEVAMTRFADLFIQRGHILVKNMNPLQEQKAITRIRTFLIEQGVYVNFVQEVWRDVYVVISGPSVESMHYKTKKTGPNTDLKVESAGNDEKRSVYRHEFQHKRHILEIPHNFGISALKSFIHKKVPNTLIF
jgi:hypothetical protein